MNLLTIIGIILTLIVTLPILGFVVILLMISGYDLRRMDPNRKPPTKDEWKAGL